MGGAPVCWALRDVQREEVPPPPEGGHTVGREPTGGGGMLARLAQTHPPHRLQLPHSTALM